MPYNRSARYYSALYGAKDYAGEAERIHELVQQYAERPCTSLLDVATGVGTHLQFLQAYYSSSKPYRSRAAAAVT